MPMFKRGADVADFPEELRSFVTSHGWAAVDDAPNAPEQAAAPAAVEDTPKTPAVPTTAVADDNPGEIHD